MLGVVSTEALGKEQTGSVAGKTSHCGWEAVDQEGSERWAGPEPDSAVKSLQKLK